MDSAHDALEIAQTSRDLGHVPIIDKNPRRKPGAKAELEAETLRRLQAPRTCATTSAAPPSASMAGSKMISAGAARACAATPRSYAI